MTTDLKGKIALITGSTSGIGLGVAQVLAARGCAIMLNGFGDPDAIEETRSALEKTYNITAAYHGADLSNGREARQCVTDTIASFGKLDILVNNAGIQHVDRVEDFPAEKWDSILAINLSAAFHTIAAAIPSMQKHGWGRIVNIASAHGLVASPNKAGYVAAKHGIVGLTKVVALENAEQSATQNITCNAICPGWVLTPLVQKQVDAWAERDAISAEQAEKALLSEKQPALRFVSPEEIGAQVAYLCSDDARMITGTTLSIDGGWTAR